MLAIEVDNLTKSFSGDRGIRNASFSITQNAFHVLAGENGAGKTTIIRSILGLYQEFSGKVLIDGVENANPRAFENIGYISETAVFPNQFNVRRYLIWVAKLKNKHARNTISSLVDSYLHKFNLYRSARTNPNKLSSGEKKKVLLIKALIEESKILIMDEPAANLDPKARTIFFNQIDDMRKNGVTILFVHMYYQKLKNMQLRPQLLLMAE